MNLNEIKGIVRYVGEHSIIIDAKDLHDEAVAATTAGYLKIVHESKPMFAITDKGRELIQEERYVK